MDGARRLRKVECSGGKIFQARWVDDPYKEKSRCVVKDFANTRNPMVFAATSDTAVGRVVEHKAVLQNYSMFTFDVSSANTHAWEDELVFLEPPQEEIEEHGDCLRRSVRVIHGRRKGARSWQENFDAIIRSTEARQRGFTVDAHPKCPTLYCIREADGLIELHVDDGHGCGKEAVIEELLVFLSEKIEIKYVQGIRRGIYEYLKTTKVRDEKKLSIPNKRYLQSAMGKLGMSDCTGAPRRSWTRQVWRRQRGARRGSDGAFQVFSAHAAVSQQRANRYPDHGASPMYELQRPTALELRQLKRLLRYVMGTEDMATVFEVQVNNDKRVTLKKLEVFTDSDWACDNVTRKSTSGAVIMAEGMRSHAHCRGQATVALSSCEAEVVAASEGIKEALLLQEVLMFAGLGHHAIEVKVDSSRRGVGRLKHIDYRVLWLQDLIAAEECETEEDPETAKKGKKKQTGEKRRKKTGEKGKKRKKREKKKRKKEKKWKKGEKVKK